jgi:hypothetical protein
MPYYMTTLNPAPSMNHTETCLGECSYQEAKESARQWALANGRPASVHSEYPCTYAWARYDSEGKLSWDRNQ